MFTLHLPLGEWGFRGRLVTRRDRAGRGFSQYRRSRKVWLVLTASTRFHPVTWCAIVGRSLCQHAGDSRTNGGTSLAPALAHERTVAEIGDGVLMAASGRRVLLPNRFITGSTAP